MNKTIIILVAVLTLSMGCSIVGGALFDFLHLDDQYAPSLEYLDGGYPKALVSILPPSSTEIHRRFDTDSLHLWVKFTFDPPESESLQVHLTEVPLEEIGSSNIKMLEERKYYTRTRPRCWPIELTNDHLKQADRKSQFSAGTYSVMSERFRTTYYVFVDTDAGQAFVYRDAPQRLKEIGAGESKKVEESKESRRK